jgi:hypothetical protein
MHYRAGSYDSGAPEYIDPGAIIDFYVPDTTGVPIMIEILDEKGDRVRSFVGRTKNQQDKPEDDGAKQEEPSMQMPESAPATAGNFTLRQGHNRFIWDLRYPSETIASEDGKTFFGPGSGPMAVPGSYMVRLSKGNWSAEQPLSLKMDPRVEALGTTIADLQAQLEHNLKVRDAIGKAKRMAAEVDSLRSDLKKVPEDHEQEMDQLDKIYHRLVTLEEGSYQAPMLIDQLDYMYSMTLRADQRPGRDAYERYEQLNSELNSIEQNWTTLKNEVDTQQ